METELLKICCVKNRHQSLPHNYITWKQYVKKLNTPYYNARINYDYYYHVRKFIWALIKIRAKSDFSLSDRGNNVPSERYVYDLFYAVTCTRNFDFANQFLDVAEKNKYDLREIIGRHFSPVFLDEKYYSIIPLNLERDVRMCFNWKYYEGYDKIISVHKVSVERIMTAIFNVDAGLQVKHVLKRFENSKNYLMKNYPEQFKIN
jgi:hypothetical protein